MYVFCAAVICDVPCMYFVLPLSVMCQICCVLSLSVLCHVCICAAVIYDVPCMFRVLPLSVMCRICIMGCCYM